MRPRPPGLHASGRSSRPTPRVAGWALLAATLTLVLGACSLASPPAATVQGREIRDLYDVVLIPTVVIFFLVEGLLLWVILRYRRRGDRLPPQTHGHGLLEITWTVLPLLVVLVIFALSMQTLGHVDAKTTSPAVTVDVTGRQWFWDFSYPDQKVNVSGAGTEAKIELPVGRTVRIRLHSDNVVHSFYVPGFLFKRDVIPGLTNEFDIDISEPGTYRGQCAEFCGFGHADMLFSIQAVSPADFDTWIRQQQSAAAASPTSGPSVGPAAGTVEVSAVSTTSFEQSALEALAGRPFTVHFTNKEAGVPHNVAIKDASGQVLFHTKINPGPADESETAPALSAGTYTFFCQVHLNMQGTLTVK